MDFQRDELRRQLRASRAEQQAAMGPWREALFRFFGPDNKVPASAKAELVGVPNRRGFLKIGGATIIGAAVLAACSDSGESGPVAESGGSGDGTTTTTSAEAAALDVTLLRTATSIEVLAVDAYNAAIESGLVTTAAVIEAAELFRDQHDEHRAALEAATEEAGGTPFTRANPFLQENVVDPALADLTNETGVVEFALTLETAAAETYVYAAGELSVPALRQAIMGIGGVEARHQAVLRGVLEEDQVPVAFQPTDEAVGEDAFLPEPEEGEGEGGGEGAGEGGGGGGDSTTTTGGESETTTTTAA
jgi:hypothetical protein